MRFTKRIAALAVVIGISACGDDGSSSIHGDAICTVVSQSQVTATANTGSTLADSQNAFDRNLDSFATLASGVVSGGATFKGAGSATHNSGTVAGVAFTTPEAGNFSFAVTTYLGGTQQETGTAGSGSYGSSSSQICPGYCENKNYGQSFFGIVTTKAFDSIQVAISTSGATSSLQVRELCVK